MACWTQGQEERKQDPTAFNPFLRLINDTGEGLFEPHLHWKTDTFSLFSERLDWKTVHGGMSAES